MLATSVSVNELLDLVFRWAHLIAGIMWIGNSMLFNWLDRNLIQRPDQGRLSQGTIYMVHSGAFYEVEKKLLAPGELPAQLHWFKWQNFTTWATGISLLVVTYYMRDAGYLRDPSVCDLTAAQAIAISVGSLVVGWAIYDALWRVLEDRPGAATVLSFALLAGASWGFTEVFSGRGAYIMTGALMGTLMTGNVWMRILPSQRSLIAATKKGEEQDALLSKRAKQRSIHNNYMTFPVLFIMLSNHFGTLHQNGMRWALLAVVMVGGALIRHFMNVRYAGKWWLAPAILTGTITLGATAGLAYVGKPYIPEVTHEVPYSRAQTIITTRCVPCHSANNTEPMYPVAPKGVMLDTTDRIKAMADQIYHFSVATETMPFINRTNMTKEERAELGKWYSDGAKTQ